MEKLLRNTCVLTNEEMEEIYRFEKFPIFMGTTEQAIEDDIREDMIWEIGKTSGLIQLKKLIPLDILYKDSHNSSIGVIWSEHHLEFAKFIAKYQPKGIFEIGGANGALESTYRGLLNDNAEWTILEAAPTIPIESCKAKYIRGFWNEDFVIPKNIVYDTLVHSHVLEHIYEPKQFMEHSSEVLNDGELMIFSLPNLHSMLIKKYTSTLNFEHTYFITEPYIEWLMSLYGFEIIEKQYFREDHSIFYATKKQAVNKKYTLNSTLYSKNKAVFNEYIAHYKKIIVEINRKIMGYKPNANIFLFGAHIFSQYLIEFGIMVSEIESILDNDVNKQNKRLYGTNLFVKSPKYLENINSPIVILFAGHYSDEIKRDIIMNINNSAIFIEEEK